MSEVALETLLCRRCGAPLQVGGEAKFVTCRHCGSSLRVERSESAAWTELTERTEQLEAKVERLDRRTERADLDREWDRTRQSLMVRGKGGRESEPSAVGGVIVLTVGVMGAVFAATMSAGAGFPTIVKLGFPALFAGVGLFTAANQFAKAAKWREAERRYRRRRAELELERGEPGEN
ncbi:alpha/beta hydrolase family protein [Alienimonas californiensis]|uniref:Uncharacterized protein n=1 Tax=Alienimonas californiensis TaxID=2527989 RepID=A0A517P3P0_9PLAN|nr:PHB depolymerase family esterase [Alienimonas californiensis]QDT13991.1 hypothetical protein CA12_00590 [Alienimonas californiensis]